MTTLLKKISLGILIIFFILIGSFEFLGRLIGFSLFVDPLTSLKRVGVYKASNDREYFNRNYDVKNSILYVSDNSKSVRVVDVSKPNKPREIAALQLDYYPDIKYVSEKFLFLGSLPVQKAAIEIFDISNPKSITKVGVYNAFCGEFCSISNIKVLNNELMYVLVKEKKNSNSDIHKISLHVVNLQDVVNIQSPPTPKELKIVKVLDEGQVAELLEDPYYRTNFREYDLDVNLNSVVISWGDQIYLFSKVSDEDFRLSQTYNIEGPQSLVCRHIQDMEIHETKLYLTELHGSRLGCGESSLRILDTSTPTSLKELGIFHFPYNVGNLDVEENYAFVGNRARGMRVFDISDPASIVEVAHYSRLTTPLYQEIWQMKVDKSYAYVVGHQVLSDIKRIDIVDISRLFKNSHR